MKVSYDHLRHLEHLFFKTNPRVLYGIAEPLFWECSDMFRVLMCSFRGAELRSVWCDEWNRPPVVFEEVSASQGICSESRSLLVSSHLWRDSVQLSLRRLWEASVGADIKTRESEKAAGRGHVYY